MMGKNSKERDTKSKYRREKPLDEWRDTEINGRRTAK